MKPLFLMMCGLPASGKSTMATSFFDPHHPLVVHSSDTLREELYGDASVQGDNKALFEELHKRVRKDLGAGKTVIYDATNLTVNVRKKILDKIADVDCGKYAIVLDTPLDVCLMRNRNRDRVVPEDVLYRMASIFSFPLESEGFDAVFVQKGE